MRWTKKVYFGAMSNQPDKSKKDNLITFRADAPLNRAVEERMRQEGIKRSKLIREIVENALKPKK